MNDDDAFGPGHPEWCPDSEEHDHCDHWWDCEPCCRCGSDEGDCGDG